MNSEKVKEIKEKLKERYYYLDQAYSDHLAYGGKADEQQEEEIYFLRDIRTLINELESENERLNKEKETLRNAKVVYENVDYCYEDLKKAEKRIAELEKGNEALSFALEQGFNDCQTKTLKQFAERLKEKYGKSCSEYYPLLLELTSEQLDETLKEFL